jgi:hypothetical protein
MAQVLIWRGILQGWLPATPSRPLAVARHRLALLQRIKGQEHVFKLAPSHG